MEYNADIAVLLSNFNWSVDANPVFGIANLGPNGDPFAISQVTHIDASRYTLAHEIGHTFGCEHDDGGPDCPKGLRMANGRNTIMARSGASFDRIQNFSNPNVIFGGLATGVEDERDNAQQIRAAFCEVADNDQHTKYGARIVHFGPVCTEEINSFYASVQTGQCYDPLFNNYNNCGVSPFSYYWEISRYANFSTTYSLGTSSSCQFAPSSDGAYYFRVTVTSDDAWVTTYSRMFIAETCPSAEWVGNEEIQILDKMKLLNNPTSDYILVNIPDEVELAQYTFYNLTGQVIFTAADINNEIINIGMEGQIEIPVQNVAAGIYILSVLTNMGAKSFQVVKL